MTNIILPDLQVTKYIPQRAPIVMISTLLESGDTYTVTGFEVKADSLFVEDGVLNEPGLIENIAQTAAAGVGYQFAMKEEAVPPGFIGAVKNLEIIKLPSVGDQLVTRVDVIQEVFEVTLIKGEIFVKENKIASCEMKIVLKK